MVSCFIPVKLFSYLLIQMNLYDLAFCIDNNDNQITFVGHLLVYCLSQRHLRPRFARAQMILLEPQKNYMPSTSHVIVLFHIIASKKI